MDSGKCKWIIFLFSFHRGCKKYKFRTDGAVSRKRNQPFSIVQREAERNHWCLVDCAYPFQQKWKCNEIDDKDFNYCLKRWDHSLLLFLFTVVSYLFVRFSIVSFILQKEFDNYITKEGYRYWNLIGIEIWWLN